VVIKRNQQTDWGSLSLKSGVIHKGSNSMINDIKVIIMDKTYLIFDLDGTIINTDEANFLSYREAVDKIKTIDLNLLYKKNERFTREKLPLVIPNLTKKRIWKYNQY